MPTKIQKVTRYILESEEPERCQIAVEVDEGETDPLVAVCLVLGDYEDGTWGFSRGEAAQLANMLTEGKLSALLAAIDAFHATESPSYGKASDVYMAVVMARGAFK